MSYLSGKVSTSQTVSCGFNSRYGQKQIDKIKYRSSVIIVIILAL